MSITEQTLRAILGTDAGVPPALIKKAESFSFQSSTLIPLKPTQEPARIHICGVLAMESLREQLDLPVPNTSKPPIPPVQYRKLLNQFRSALDLQLPAPERPQTPRKLAVPRSRASPNRTSPARAPRSTRGTRNFSAEADPDLLFTEQSDEEFVDDEVSEFRTPTKQAPKSSRNRSPSPRKSPRKSPKKICAPTNSVLTAIGERMELQTSTVDAVKQAYEQYWPLVKDPWGLVYGLFVVISERVEPKMGNQNEQRLAKALTQLAPDVYVDRNEWIHWTEQIVAGQSWLMQISHTPEPHPLLNGAPGGWGLGVEYTLI